MINNSFSENRAFYQIMWKKYGTDRQATDDDIIRRIGIACCITKARDTHSEYEYFLLFHGNSAYANAPQYSWDLVPSYDMNVTFH
jgi:hypothetical protein